MVLLRYLDFFITLTFSVRIVNQPRNSSGSFINEPWAHIFLSSIHLRIFFRAIRARFCGNCHPYQALIALYVQPDNRGKALGLLAIVASLAVILWPIAGGFITTYLGWNWIFFINFPIGITAVYSGMGKIRGNSISRKPKPLISPVRF